MRRRAAILLLPWLVSCVASPPHRPLPEALEVPDEWNARPVRASPAEGRWWTRFSDDQLDSLVSLALEANHDIQRAAARMQQAAASARIDAADLKPLVGAALDGARRQQNFIGFPIPGRAQQVLRTSSTRYGLSLETTWEVDLWGRIRAAARAGLADFAASQADLRGVKLSIAAQTVRAWFALAEANQQVDLAEDTVARRHQSAQQVRSRFERGLRPAVDLRLALSNLADAEAEVERERRRRDAAMRQLQVLLGRYPSDSLAPFRPPAGLPREPPPVPVGLPAELIGRRPDVVAAGRRLAAADQRLRWARRSLYPRLSLTGTGGTTSTELADLVDGDFRVWSLAANLMQPLFQGGRLRAGVARADAAAQEALALYAGTALQAFAEVETALAAETFLAGEEARQAESAAQLQAASDLARSRYQRGIGDYLTVLESETRELAARSALLSVRRLRLDTRVDLHLALGGGFETGLRPTRRPGRRPERGVRADGEAP
ncbi:MAG: efflux transporter outer membrane subunit [Acidobacteriota bacterium]